jgi:inner membrane protein
MEPRYRGLFKVNSYATHAQLNARWDDVSGLVPKPRHEASRMACLPAKVAVAVTDARGIQATELRLNQQVLPVLPGSGMGEPAVGFHANLDETLLTAGQTVRVAVNVELAGTQSLSVVPVGDTTLAKVSANWPHPAFGGRFLPSERQVGEQGFNATWKVSALATTAQQHWRNGAELCPTLSNSEPLVYQSLPTPEGQAGRHVPCVESFGVDFMDPVNPYVLNDRATKYGLLFIVLTFVGVGLIEALRQLRVHPIQYLLVGAALAVFFLLLLSLSEHMAFAWAYVSASVACTLLLMFYGAYVLQGWWAGMGFGVAIATLFGTLYVLLQMEQTALVLGAVLMFLVLVVIMVSTRKLNWYALMAQLREQAGQTDV